MLDRQDIDALLIGALYGELTPADEARLQTHLESHPADKSALADLTSARNAVRESRFLTVQLEPPQAVSALLLQEASRRAPAKVVAKEEVRESWFQRFIASFARNPAWAAAAMLVLVVGVAGTMYLRGGDKAGFADQTTSTAAPESDRASAPAAPAAAPGGGAVEEAAVLERNAGSAFTATLADPEPAKEAQDIAGADKAAAMKKDERDQKAKAAVAAKPPAANRTYFGVESRPPKPMDLDAVAKGGERSREDANARGGATTGAARPSDVPRTEKSEPVVATPSPSPPPRAPQTVTRGVGGSSGVANDELSKESEETTWAREQHTKVTTAVRANNCREASQLAVQLSNRAPAYYTQNVEQDRSLKQCMTYITAAREREVERQQRARALQKRNAEEADRAKRAAPTSDSNK